LEEEKKKEKKNGVACLALDWIIEEAKKARLEKRKNNNKGL
jgi:hypothetical protein